MINPSADNTNFYWSTIFFRELQSLGVQHIVISPGSRSTPLTLAVAANPHFEKHIILDERSAAFTALGIGKATNIPAVLICTSGTAVANYFPAVIEARKSGVPLILATADRPPKLHNTGANQSIDQQHIFGDYTVLFNDTGEPSTDKQHLNRLKTLAQQAITVSQDEQGPVHFNFPFDKPLEPNHSYLQQIAQENEALEVPAIKNQPGNAVKSFRLNNDTLYEIQAAERPLIIVGQLAPSIPTKHIFGLAEWLKAPVLSEQEITDMNYAIQGFDGFLRNTTNLKELEPDLILRFGLQPASKSVLKAVEYWQAEHHFHFADTNRFIDIAQTTTQRIRWNGTYFDESKFVERHTKWLQKWKKAEHDFFDISTQLIDTTSQLTDGHLYHSLIPVVPKDCSIFISNSLPARDRSLFARFAKQQVFTNRGVSGIDGITSTAIGITLASRKPCVLFTGDLAFLHDSNALLNHKLLKQPLVIVVINNAGGSIFRMLPIEEHEEFFSTYFETPQSVDIGSLVRSHGIPFHHINSLQKLKDFDLPRWINQRQGLSVVECRTDADASMKLRKQMWEIQI